MSNFKFDADALKTAVLNLAEEHVRGRADDLQRLVDQLSTTPRANPSPPPPRSSDQIPRPALPGNGESRP